LGRLILLGVAVDPLTIPELNALVSKAVDSGDRFVIANHNLHSIYLWRRDARMRAFYTKAGAIHIDGMALVIWSRLLGYPVRRDQRVTYVDWIRPLMGEASRRGWRVFHLGSRQGIGDRASEILRTEFPGLQIRSRHGYFDSEGKENEEILREIADDQPHILLVGMGMPRQEHWILTNLERLTANAILTSGACFDFLAGAIPTPPRWIARLGQEWLYRLYSEPRRLWRRYLVEPWYLLPEMMSDLKRHSRRRT